MTGNGSSDSSELVIRYGSFDTQEMMDVTGQDILRNSIIDFNNIEQNISITSAHAYYDFSERRLEVVITRIKKHASTSLDGLADGGRLFMKATEKNLKTLLRMRLREMSIRITSDYNLNDC